MTRALSVRPCANSTVAGTPIPTPWIIERGRSPSSSSQVSMSTGSTVSGPCSTSIANSRPTSSAPARSQTDTRVREAPSAATSTTPPDALNSSRTGGPPAGGRGVGALHDQAAFEQLADAQLHRGARQAGHPAEVGPRHGLTGADEGGAPRTGGEGGSGTSRHRLSEPHAVVS
ncbi:hypothetical protein GCM10020220_058750 [Nonomuraea rubra]